MALRSSSPRRPPSLAFGLMASTLLILVLLPALYAIFHDLGLTSVAREAVRPSIDPTANP